MVEATWEHDLAEDGRSIASIRATVTVDDETTPEQAALAVGAAKALMYEAQRLVDAANVHAPNDAASLFPSE